MHIIYHTEKTMHNQINVVNNYNQISLISSFEFLINILEFKCERNTKTNYYFK
jgi:hypothetical protein